MPFLANKQPIKQEIEALKQYGYSVNFKSTLSPFGKPVPTIEIIPNGQAEGITIVYQDDSFIPKFDMVPPGQKEKITVYYQSCTLTTQKDDLATLKTNLNATELSNFIKDFPKNIAPIIADALKTEPPKPVEQHRNDYSLKLF